MTFNHKLVDKFLEAIFPLPEKFGVICSNDDDNEDEPIDFWTFQESLVYLQSKCNMFNFFCNYDTNRTND